MRVLHLTPQLPWPADSGGRICAWNQLRIDSRFADVGLLSFVESQPDAATIEAIQHVAHEAELVRRPRTLDGVVGGARSLLSSTAMNLAKYRWPVFSEALRAFVHRWKPDIVVAHHLHMGYYLPEVTGAATILREHNLDSDLMARYAKTLKNPAMASFAERQVAQIRDAEAKILPRVGRCLMISAEEETKVGDIVQGAKTTVLPGAVDLTEYSPINPPGAEADPLIVAAGSFDWRPTGEGVVEFVETVWPRVHRALPRAVFRVIGSCPPALARRLQARPGVEVLGRVERVRPHIEGAHAFVVPVRSGGGMRIRILESLAWQIPTVSTPIGCEGVGVQHGRHLLIGNTPAELADAVVRLVKEPVLAQTLRREGRRHVEKHFTIDALEGLTARIYQRLLEEAAVGQGSS